MGGLIVDGFAGPGGWSEGLRILGLRDIGLEWDTAACRTRAAAGHLTVQCDIAQYPTAPFVGRIWGGVFSPPCQAWSRAGKGLGRVDQPLVHQAVTDLAQGRDTRASLITQCQDKRSMLAAEPMRWLYDLRPEWAAMEEVPDVLPLFRQIAEVLRGWGYSTWAGILNAADYGVPQTRRRAILIASRVRRVSAPEPTHAKEAEEASLFGPGRARWVSIAEALGWGATDRPVPTVTGGGKTGGAEPFPSQARAALQVSRDRVLRSGTQTNAAVRELDEPAGTLFFGARCNDVSWVLRNGNQPNAAVRTPNEPAPTMAFDNNASRVEWVQQRPATTVCATDRSPGGESQFASPNTLRVTQAEAAVLQSFRPDYPWQGTKKKQFEQIGNAWCPRAAAAVIGAGTGIEWQPLVARCYGEIQELAA